MSLPVIDKEAWLVRPLPDRALAKGIQVRKTALVFMAFACLMTASLAFLTAPASAFNLFGKNPETETSDIADPLSYSATFDATGLSVEEADALQNASALLADMETPVSGSLGLITKANADRDSMVGRLYELARYAGVVDIRINRRPLDTIQPTTSFPGSTPPNVSIRVRGGDQFRFGTVQVTGVLENDLPLVTQFIASGELAYSTAILDEQDRLISELRLAGYPFAELIDSIVEADHDRKVLDVTLVLRSGPKAAFGQTLVSGAQDVDPDFIRE